MIYRTKDSWMQSPEYRQLRHKRFTMQGNCCQDCGQWGGLELHHETYSFGAYRSDKYGIAWGTESVSDVVGLCRECHRRRHVDINGEFWADPEEKYWHWEPYWDELAKD